MYRRLALTVADRGSTLKAAEPEDMVKATVVFSMAAAVGLMAGRAALRRGPKSHRFPSRSFRGKEP